MSKHSEREIACVDDPALSNGVYYRERLIEGDQLGEGVKVFAKITVTPGTTMTYHAHVDDQETYYILSGTGEYNFNGDIVSFEPGDVFFCPAGNSHSISNTGDVDVEFIALIVEA